MISMNNIELEKRYFCFQCGEQAFACDLKDHVCVDQFPHLSIQYTKPKWYNRIGSWIVDNFTGMLGFVGVNICAPVFAHHFGFKGFEGLFFGVGSGFLCAYLFIMARDH
jgi:hypothetical protein